MRRSKYSPEQMVRILREADATSLPEAAKKHGVSEQTLYVWRKKLGTLDVADAKRLEELEVENGRLKKLLAEKELSIEVMKEVAAKKW